MIHDIATVAQNRFLDLPTVKAVAATSRNVIRDASGIYVSTATADAFITEVRTAQGDAAANAAIRQREIAARQGRRA